MTSSFTAEKACCFTGHRDIPAPFVPVLVRRLEKAIENLAAQDVLWFIAGGALGFDTLAALAVLRLRDTKLPHIRLLLALPCADQTAGWSAENVSLYEHIRAKADEVKVLSPHYFRGCMQVRNRFMVDNAAFCVCYLTKDAGGTAGTVRYAEKKGRTLISLAEDMP